MVRRGEWGRGEAEAEYEEEEEEEGELDVSKCVRYWLFLQAAGLAGREEFEKRSSEP